MPNLKNKNTSNAELLAEAMRFEHWARFHCMREIIYDMQESNENSTSSSDATENTMPEAIIQVPEILVQVCNEEAPHLSALLERIQNREISMDSSRTHILAFLNDELKLEEAAFAQEVQRIGTSKKFTRYLDVF